MGTAARRRAGDLSEEGDCPSAPISGRFMGGQLNLGVRSFHSSREGGIELLKKYISLKGGPQRTTCRKSRVDAVMVGGNEGRSTPQHLIHSLVRVSFCSEEAEKLYARFPRLPFSCGSGSNLR